MTNVMEQLGAWAVIRIQEMGRMLLFMLSAFAWLVRPPFRFHQIMKQLHFIGYRSTSVSYTHLRAHETGSESLRPSR